MKWTAARKTTGAYPPGRRRAPVRQVESPDGRSEPSCCCHCNSVVPGLAPDQRPAQYRHGGGHGARQRVLMGQPGFPEGAPGKLVIV
jgi:hypothetical protein